MPELRIFAAVHLIAACCAARYIDPCPRGGAEGLGAYHISGKSSGIDLRQFEAT